MKEKIINCIQDGILYSSEKEELKLEILFDKPASIQTLPPQTPIRILDQPYKSVRSTPTKFPKDIPCPMIKHELSHHLGLPDEYREPGNTNTCRVVTNFDSMMSSTQDLSLFDEKNELSCCCPSDHSDFTYEPIIHIPKPTEDCIVDLNSEGICQNGQYYTSYKNCTEFNSTESKPNYTLFSQSQIKYIKFKITDSNPIGSKLVNEQTESLFRTYDAYCTIKDTTSTNVESTILNF